MTHELWRVQLWLADYLIEEHIAPAALAEQYANVIRLRIRGLPGRRLLCAPVRDRECLTPAPSEARSTIEEFRRPSPPILPSS